MRLRTIALLLVSAMGVTAAPATAKLGPNPSDKKLASEFLRVLQSEDAKALKAWLSPAFLLQRPDGTFLTKRQYLENPSKVESFKVTEVVGTRTGNVRVVRYTAQTNQTIDGVQITGEPVPRLSTYVKAGKTWRIVSHANFSPIPKS